GRHLRALLSESSHRCHSNSAGGAGDDRYFSFELHDYFSLYVRSIAHNPVSRISMGARTNLPSGSISNPGQTGRSDGGFAKNLGPCLLRDHTPATGSNMSCATSIGFFPSACMIHSACRFQKRIDFESGEYRGAYPPSLMRNRFPPDAGVVHTEMAPPRADANAIDCPSADQSAATSISSASVTRSALPFRMSIFQMSSLPDRSVCVYTI